MDSIRRWRNLSAVHPAMPVQAAHKSVWARLSVIAEPIVSPTVSAYGQIVSIYPRVGCRNHARRPGGWGQISTALSRSATRYSHPMYDFRVLASAQLSSAPTIPLLGFGQSSQNTGPQSRWRTSPGQARSHPPVAQNHYPGSLLHRAHQRTPRSIRRPIKQTRFVNSSS